MTDTIVAPATGTRVRANDPLYWEVSEWLDDESTMLDASHTMEWTALLAKDLVYRLPVRQNRLRDDPESQFASGMFHYDENHTTLVMKVMRLATTASPWAENPMSRTRRFVTNVRVHRTAVDDEIEVSSSLLMTRSRYTEPHPLILTAERQDLLRRTGDSFLLARRTILVDQATLGYPNLAVFF
ncbi:MAG: 3-phenylpropionate/cinnamic acid dioxygenase subunit beta [Frankiales bacterium]|nr:3-phenylpropionate/cinnamic acid dioxygenase subunit beta [Frankiales bacterium]